MVDSHSEHRFPAPPLEKGSRKPVLGVCDRLQYLRFCLLKCMLMCLFFVIRCLYSAVTLTLVREYRFIRIIIIGFFNK